MQVIVNATPKRSDNVLQYRATLGVVSQNVNLMKYACIRYYFFLKLMKEVLTKHVNADKIDYHLTCV